MVEKCKFKGGNCGGTWNASNGDCECPPSQKPDECQESLRQKLSMYETDVDFVIAESEEDARKILIEHGYEESDLADIEVAISRSEESDFTLRLDDESKETKTVKQWIEERGRCYFACTEY